MSHKNIRLCYAWSTADKLHYYSSRKIKAGCELVQLNSLYYFTYFIIKMCLLIMLCACILTSQFKQLNNNYNSNHCKKKLSNSTHIQINISFRCICVQYFYYPLCLEISLLCALLLVFLSFAKELHLSITLFITWFIACYY